LPPEHQPVPNNPFSEVDGVLGKLPLGRVVFNVPEKMHFQDSYKINLLLSASKSLEELKKQLPDSVEGAEIHIAEKMQARLTGQAFTIVAVSPEIQAISGQENTEWQWEVRPQSSGKHTLHLTLDVFLVVHKSEVARSITTFDRAIVVEVTLGERVTSFVIGNWQWLWTGILIPVGAWAWKKKKEHGKQPSRPAKERKKAA